MQACFITANRLDLFFKTVASVGRLDDAHLLTEVDIIDDASHPDAIPKMELAIAEALPGRPIRFHTCSARRGYWRQMELWRTLLKGPFSFHCEDDWEFKDAGSPLTSALRVLDHHAKLMQVGFTWARRGRIRQTPKRDRYWIVQTDTAVQPSFTGVWRGKRWKWPGYTANPSIVRVSAFKLPFTDEPECEFSYGQRMAALGWQTGYLEHKLAHHLGAGRSVFSDYNTPR